MTSAAPPTATIAAIAQMTNPAMNMPSAPGVLARDLGFQPTSMFVPA